MWFGDLVLAGASRAHTVFSRVIGFGARRSVTCAASHTRAASLTEWCLRLPCFIPVCEGSWFVSAGGSADGTRDKPVVLAWGPLPSTGAAHQPTLRGVHSHTLAVVLILRTCVFHSLTWVARPMCRMG